MIDAKTTTEMWDIVRAHVAEQRSGKTITAEQVYADLDVFLAEHSVSLPAMFMGAVPFELVGLTIEAGVVLATTRYPETGEAQHIHPVFIACGSKLPNREEWGDLADHLEKSFCPPAADAAEESRDPIAPVEPMLQHIEMTKGKNHAHAWISPHMAVEDEWIEIGDDAPWKVSKVWPTLITMDQAQRLPPAGYLTETFH